MKDITLLREPGLESISLAEKIASTIPSNQTATVLTELQTLIKLKPILN